MRLTVVLTSLLTLGVSTETGCMGPQISQEQRDEALRAVHQAREARGGGHLERALEEIERALGLAPDEASIWGERGKICYAIYTTLAAEGRGGLDSVGFLEDARFSLERARSLRTRDSEAVVLLSRIYREDGLWKEALGAAEHALELTIDRSTRVEALLEIGRARLAKLALDARSEEQPVEPAARLAPEALAAADPLEEATSLDPSRAEAWVALADVYALAGNPSRELETLRRGLNIGPSSELLHVAYQDRLFARNRALEAAGFLSGLLREDPNNATVRWFRARARLARAEELRGENKGAEAIGQYEQAIADWEETARGKPAYTSSCNQAIAFARLGIATILTGEGRLEKATELLIKAYRLWPALFDQTDRFGVSYSSAMSAIGKTLMGGGRGFFAAQTDAREEAVLGRPATFKDRAASLRKAVVFHKMLIAMHPDRQHYLGFWYNNIGLALRDLGRLIAEEKATPAEEGATPSLHPEAVQAWEEAREAYDRAVELLPTDPRVINDSAVMLVYHLHRDFDQAEKLLLRAVELAQAELDAWADEMPEATRNFYEEAAGDALENLGLLFLWHRQDPTQARDYLERSLKYYPYGTRAAARTLRTLPAPQAPSTEESALEPAAVQAHWHAYAIPGALALEDPLKAALKLLDEAAGASPSEAIGIHIEALAVLENQLRKTGPSAPLLHLLGRILLGMANAEIAGRRDGLTIEGYLEEASQYLAKALELDRTHVDSHVLLIETEILRNKPGGVGAAAARLATLLDQRAKTMEPAVRNRATAMAGHGLYREYVRQKTVESQGGAKADEKLGDQAGTLLERVHETALAGKGHIDGVASPQVVATDLALLRRWQRRNVDAVKVLAAWALRVSPDPAVLSGLLDAGRGGAQAQAVEAFASLLKNQGEDPTLGWYHGAALCEAGDEKRRIGDNDAALAHYDRSIAAMRKVIRARPDFGQTARTFIVRALSGKGFAALAQKQLDLAGTHFLAALAEDPSLKDTRDHANLTPADGIVRVAHEWRQQRQPDQAIALYRKALELVPSQVTFSNNMALFARDFGATQQRLGKLKEAEELFELALSGYRNAVKHAPEDVRLINDLALVMVYHVPRLLDEAEVLLERAVTFGEKQLKVFPEDDPNGRQQLEDAVGDAWQNIGHVQLIHRKNLDAAEKAFNQSLRYCPFEDRPVVRRHLATIRTVRAEIAAKKRAEEERKKKEAEEERKRKEEEERKRKEGRGEQPPGGVLR